MTSRGCRARVEITPPDIPAIKCSYLTWLLNKSMLSFKTDDGVIFVVADIISLIHLRDVISFAQHSKIVRLEVRMK